MRYFRIQPCIFGYYINISVIQYICIWLPGKVKHSNKKFTQLQIEIFEQLKLVSHNALNNPLNWTTRNRAKKVKILEF